MAVEFPAWAIKAIDKIWLGFLWRGRRDALGVHYTVAWLKVRRPKDLGGLRISHLKTLDTEDAMGLSTKNRVELPLG
jgi:hypothetical protein